MYSNIDNVNILTGVLQSHGVRRVVVCPGSRNAPIVHNLNETEGITCYPVTDERSAGFVAPLDFLGGDQLSEILLVPYFGACIHVPPPPANQIVYVILEKPMGIQMMDTVMVYGKLEIEKSESDIGDAGYRIKAVAVEPYAADETEPN